MVTELLTRPKSFTDILQVRAGLPEEDQKMVDGILAIRVDRGELDLSPLDSAIESGDFKIPEGLTLEDLATQTIISTMNHWDHRQARFNELRLRRPQEMYKLQNYVDEIEAQRGIDAFCRYLTHTPIEKFGQVRGKTSVIRGNLFKFGKFHGVQIFDEHSPLAVPTEYEVLDQLDSAENWCWLVHNHNPDAKYPDEGHNSNRKGGASILHGHRHVELGVGWHNSEMEELLSICDFYHHMKEGDYCDDLFRVHQLLGYGVEKDGVKAFPSLTPIKDHHIVAFIKDFRDERARRFVYRIIRDYSEVLGVKSYNLSISHPPIAPDGRDWSGVPTVVQIVSRGDPMTRNNDIAVYELLKRTSVVASSPDVTNKCLLRAAA